MQIKEREQKINNNFETVDIKNENQTEEEMLKKKRRDKIKIVLTGIIVLLLILFVIMAVRIGKIGYRIGDLKEVSGLYDNVSIIDITKDDVSAKKIEALDIFVNERLNNKKLIAPNSHGSYKFCVQNTADDDVKYDINFTDEMTEKINMKYRLKIDNIYIRGSKDEYVDISDLSVQEIKVLRNSNNVFTLEWLWQEASDEEDTYVGSLKEDVKYTLNLSIVATRIGI